MKQQILSVILGMMIIMSIFGGMTGNVNAENNNEEIQNLPNPIKPLTTYHITNVWELQNMSNDLTGNYILDNSIDASITSTWNGGIGFLSFDFDGTFNGQNYSIYNLYRNNDTTIGYDSILFQDLSGIIENVRLINISLKLNNSICCGGIVGQGEIGSKINNILATGNIYSYYTNGWIGGIIGNSNGFIYNTTSYVNVNQMIGTTLPSAGGFFSRQGSTTRINNCSAHGNVLGQKYAGSFGGVGGSSNTGYAFNCFGVGLVTGTNAKGFQPYSVINTINCYYDNQTTGQTEDYTTATGKYTTAMKQQATFVGWDFTNIWWINETFTYPQLKNLNITYPLANAGEDLEIRIGQNIEFNASQSFGEINNWTWEFDYNSTTYNFYTESFNFTFYSGGFYNITLIITDYGGFNDTDIIMIYVFDYPTAIISDAPYYAYVNSSFDAYGWESYDNDGNITNWTWDFNSTEYYNKNSTISTNGMVAGTHNLMLEVTDNDGYKNWTNASVYLQDWPYANPGTDRTDYWEIQFNGSNSLGEITNWTWESSYDGGIEFWSETPTYNFTIPGVYQINLTVTDGNYSHTSSFNLTVDFPEINAGSDDTISRGNYQLNATLSDIDFVNYTWNFTHDGAKVIYGIQPTFNFTILGTHMITLTGITDKGYTDIDFVNITVENTPPVAVITPEYEPYVIRLSTYTFNGSASYDPDWTAITNYTWTFDDGGAKTLWGVSPTYTFNSGTLGNRTVMLRVRDFDGAYGYTNSTINITSVPPIANAGTDQSGLKGTYQFDGSLSTDPDGIVSNWTWTFTYNGTLQTVYGETPDFYFYTNGTYMVTLVVTDSEGTMSLPDYVNITISWLPPTANAGPDKSQRRIIVMEGSGSDLDGWIVNYTWNFTYNGNPITLYGVSTYWDFNVSGNYLITLTVTDNDGLTDSDTALFTVRFVESIAYAGADQSGYRDTYNFAGTYSLNGTAKIIWHRWNFTYNGSAITLFGQSQSYYFWTPGTYVLTYTIMNDQLRLSSDTMTITILTLNPDADFEYTPDDDNKGEKIVSSLSTDDDGFISNYTWSFTYNSIPYVRYGENFTFTFNLQGNHAITLNVTDNDGLTDEITKNLTIVFKSPVASIIGDVVPPPYKAQSMTEKTLYSDSTDEDGYIINWTWTFTHDNTSYTYYGENFTHRYNATDETFNLTLTVTDDDGLTNSTTVEFWVINPITQGQNILLYVLPLAIVIMVIVYVFRGKFKDIMK